MKTILLDIENHIGKITLNRPERYNAINKTMAVELLQALSELDEDPEIRCVMLTGKGKAFCSGQDLTEIKDPSDPRVSQILPELLNPISLKLRSLTKPVLCVVNGVAVGAGANIALCCDIVIAADSAVFTQAFTRIGLISDSGGTYVLPRLIGLQKAMALMMLAEDVPGKEAAAMGMIYRSFAEEQLEESALKIARKLAGMPTKALYYTRMALNESMHASFEQQLENEARWQEKAGKTDDFIEGVTAFLEKRRPVFNGK